MHTVLVSKIASLALMAALSLLSALIPLKLTSTSGQTQDQEDVLRFRRRRRRGQIILKVLLNFSGGVLLSTCFLHLIPDVREEFQRSLPENNRLSELFPVAELTVCLGYFAIYAIEELIEFVLCQSCDRSKHHDDVDEDDNVVQQTSSSNKFQNGGHEHHQHVTDHDDDCFKIRYLISPAGGDTIEPRQCFSTVHHVRGCQTYKTAQLQSGSGSPSEQCTLLVVEGKSEAQCRWTAVDYESTRGSTPPPPCPPPSPPPSSPPPPLEVKNKERSLSPTGQVRGTLRSMMLIVGLSFHSIFEGMAIGLQTDASSVWMAFVAVSLHKFIMAFCVGVKVFQMNNKIAFYAVCMITFCLVSPIGIAIGTAVTEAAEVDVISTTDVVVVGGGGSVTVAVLQGLASGTLLYVTFFEILARTDDKAAVTSPLLNFLAVFGGFALIAAVQTLDGGHEVVKAP